jgi:hypothetical protein
MNLPHNTNDLGGDELLRQLAAADPVERATVPVASDDTPRTLLENIMNEPAHTGPGSVSVLNATSTANTHGGSPRRSSLGGRASLVAVAAAVIVLLGGVLVFAPDNAQPALATVHSAAAATADADTGRIVSTFSVDADDNESDESLSLNGSLDAAYAGSDIEVNVEASGLADNMPFDELPLNRFRLVDDVIYLDMDGSWMSLDTNGLLGDVVADYVDPRSVLEQVEELTETTEVGSVDIDGQSTTHYQSVVDLADETVSESGWAGHEAFPVEAEGEVTVDLYVGDNDLLRRLEMSGDLADGGDGESGTFNLVMDFVDIGADITVEAPADAEEFDPFGGGFDFDSDVEEDLDA